MANYLDNVGTDLLTSSRYHRHIGQGERMKRMGHTQTETGYKILDRIDAYRKCKWTIVNRIN